MKPENEMALYSSSKIDNKLGTVKVNKIIFVIKNI